MLISTIEKYSNQLNDIKLYDYQSTILKHMINHEYNAHKIGYLILPSGMGKSMLTLTICKNNGLSLLVIPDNMITNYSNRLQRYKVRYIVLRSENVRNYQSLAVSRTNVILTTPEFYDNIIRLELEFSRIIFDDTELDENYKHINTDFTWVISASILYMEDINPSTIIRCSQGFINNVFKFENVQSEMICCDNDFDIQEDDIEYQKMLHEDDFEQYIKYAKDKDKVTDLIKLRNSLNVYSTKLSAVINIVCSEDNDFTLLFVKNNHEFIKSILFVKYDIISEILKTDEYDIINKFNNKEIKVLLIKPDFKGVGLIQAKKIIIYDELNEYETENCIGRVLRQSRSKSLKLNIYTLTY